MLKNFKTFTSFSAKDLDEIKNFYHEKLGLDILEEIDGVIVFKTGGDTRFMVYAKENHEPATYTVLNFDIDNIEEVAKSLNEKGINMEQYPQMGTNEMGISDVGDGGKMAWFKDPAGNILSLAKME